MYDLSAFSPKRNIAITLIRLFLELKSREWEVHILSKYWHRINANECDDF